MAMSNIINTKEFNPVKKNFNCGNNSKPFSTLQAQHEQLFQHKTQWEQGETSVLFPKYQNYYSKKGFTQEPENL